MAPRSTTHRRDGPAAAKTAHGRRLPPTRVSSPHVVAPRAGRVQGLLGSRRGTSLGVQLCCLGRSGFERYARLFPPIPDGIDVTDPQDLASLEGDLPDAQLDLLVNALARHTSTPDDCLCAAVGWKWRDPRRRGGRRLEPAPLAVAPDGSDRPAGLPARGYGSAASQHSQPELPVVHGAVGRSGSVGSSRPSAR